MSSVESLLSALRRSGVRLWVEGDDLRYRAPKAVLSRLELDELRRRKSEIVDFLQHARDLMGRTAPPLVARLRPERIPLSYAQERLWFLEQLGLVGSAYHVATAIRLEGALDVGALERGIGEVARRHESVRTRFAAVDGQGVQVIEVPQPYRLEVVDLSALGPRAGPGEARRLAQEHAAEQFDLATGPLLRVKLLRLGAGEHVMLVNMHHIVSDGWSMGVMVREIGALYGAYAAGLSSPLGDLAVQYADYALWQRDWLAGEVLARQVGYWKERLSGAPAALELPSDRLRPALQSFAGGVVEFSLSGRLSAQLGELSRREGATLYMVLLAAFSLLLWRYSGQRDVVVGSPIAGRRYRELEQLIGFFVNTLVLRTDLSGEPSFRALLGRVKETALGAYAHQDLPFEKLVEELKPPRDLSRQPLAQVMFALQNAPTEELRLPGLNISRVWAETAISKSDLSLHVFEFPSGLQGKFEYATALFEAATIARLAGHFERLLEGIVADPQRPISELPMLSEAERHRLVVEYNDTAADYPRQCVHELFAAQAARTPDAIALVCAEAQLSYGELDRRANRLAHYLRERGVGPEVVVGLCVERSAAMVIGVLGILKAGGAYLPLEPSYPPERLAYMLGDAKALLLLTQTQLAERLPPHPAQLVCLDAHWQDIARQPAAAPPAPTTPDNLAYVIYTSGSTGRPKGVLVEHRRVVNYVWAVSQAVGLDDRLSYLMVQPLSVDSSITVLYGALLRGGLLHLTSYEASLDARWLIDYASRHPIDCLKIAPPHLQLLVDAPQGARILPRQRLIVGGDVSHWDWIERLGRLSPQCRIFNHYGPTEATVGITVYAVDASNARGASGGVPIGRPLGNSQAYILDARLQPVPVGVVGGLYLGGEPIVRGYHCRAGLTAASFMPDPFAAEGGRRLYRTGDQARVLPDGNIEFLGREDDQVKIHGYRIELDEIANVLMEHGAVRQAVVVPIAGSGGDKALAAYVVLRTNETPAALRRYLAARLPGYMVPATLDVLDALPRTPHGKLDRNALPAPKDDQQSDQYVAPGTATEATVAEIWGELLKRDRVSIDDDFFVLGGHSLVATRVIARLRDAFDVELPLRALFEAVTVRTLAEHIEMIRWAAHGSTIGVGEEGLMESGGFARNEGTL